MIICDEIINGSANVMSTASSNFREKVGFLYFAHSLTSIISITIDNCYYFLSLCKVWVKTNKDTVVLTI